MLRTLSNDNHEMNGVIWNGSDIGIQIGSLELEPCSKSSPKCHHVHLSASLDRYVSQLLTAELWHAYVYVGIWNYTVYILASIEESDSIQGHRYSDLLLYQICLMNEVNRQFNPRCTHPIRHFVFRCICYRARGVSLADQGEAVRESWEDSCQSISRLTNMNSSKSW